MNRTHNEFEIFFHVGLGRAASTFLQNRIFPELEGIKYIPRDRYRKFSQLIEKSNHKKYLISREAALRLNLRLEEFSSYRKDGKVILVLRRHDQWIASHYRRYVKNGGSYTFENFIDLDAHKPKFFGADNIQFMNMIKMIENHFDSPPLVLFQEELINNLGGFVSRLTAFTGTKCNLSQIRLERVHASYDSKQLKIARQVGSLLFSPLPKPHPNPSIHRINRRINLITCHLILFLARLVPASLVGDEPLIAPQQLARIRKETAHDWASCKAYAEKHNPLPNQPITLN
ncbi:MAG: hypothetical protein CL402_07430 [Acidiferrobacteraceae bacterium]|nr:hypothetical protein [Acidiferrobacteraceae bacterium]|tara:strand:- start:647 stop:1507 length:861 start_codon:yes stop_codon:yes gene_type:complete